MRKPPIFVAVLLTFFAALDSCTRKADSNADVTPVTALTRNEQIAIALAGFSPDGAFKKDGGYLVEGDILLTAADLAGLGADTTAPAVRIAHTEQYRTTRLITGLPRTITVAVDAGASNTVFARAADTAIARYNKLALRLRFKRVSMSAGPEIVIRGRNLGAAPDNGTVILGQSAGFPDSTGRAASPILLNTQYFTSAYSNIPFLGSVIAHEIGHAIGFRHTDYMDRSYSCGRTPWFDFLKLLGFDLYNEGATDVGAIHISGTPAGPDAASWMLACNGSGNRPFNSNDVKALKALYQ